MFSRRSAGGRVELLIFAAGAALTALALWLIGEISPVQRTPVRLASFVVVPVVILVVFVVSRGHRRGPLLAIVALLDLEAILISELPAEGLALAVVIPMMGVAFVSNLLTAERLRVAYVAAWCASTIGVATAVLTSAAADGALMPAWAIVPTLAVVDATGLLVLWQTNSRRTAAMRAIAEAETRFRELIDGVDLLAADIGRDGKLQFANEFGSRLLGISKDDAVGLDWYETFVPVERRAEARARLEAMAAGTELMPRRRESEIATLNGERHLIRWSHVIRRDERGRFASMASIGEDITAARQAEEAFRRASEVNHALIVSSPVPTVILGLDRTVQLWNPAAASLLGWSADEVVGMPLPGIVAGGDASVRTGLFEMAIGGAPVRGMPVTLRRRDGAVINVLVYGAALRDREGNPVSLAAQAIDVTAQQAMEERLREAQKMEAVGRLAGGIAHDFNNNLTAIGGFAALIADATEDPMIRDDAESIAASVRRAANLTRELLAYARRSLLQPEAIDVNALIATIRPMLRRLLREDIQLVIESDIRDAVVRVDPSQLEQAILNLTANARDAMPNGGRLTIRTLRRTFAGPDAAGSSGSFIVIAVGDTGEGIPLAMQAHVFDPFFTTKPVGAGTGLGLAMVQGFVLQSGGRVHLDSQPGAGTVVEILLPEASERVGQPIPGAAPAPEPLVVAGSGETVLFVEDEPAVAAVGFQLLSRRGYRVLLADSGSTAIALLEAHPEPIALLLLDVILPDMRGPQVADAARTTHPEAAVLYASGYSADTFVRRGELDPSVDLIEKPYAAEQLALRVRSAIEQRRRALEAANADLDADTDAEESGAA